jgi:methionine-rich copper-binding protein CopC
MVIPSFRPVSVLVAATLGVAAMLLGGCAGNGMGLDANGNPSGSESSAPAPLSADFQSIQDNVFTPICTRCHSGANAPEGLQLDEGHSFALLVGVPSAEAPGVLRVKPGDPTDSYLIEKLQGSSGIVGQQMPFGGPYLPQATIDVIKQWITAGALATSGTAGGMAAVSRELSGVAALSVTATMPADGSRVAAPLATIAIGVSEAPDTSFLNGAVQLQDITAQPLDVAVLISQAQGNPATVLLTPAVPLGPGVYRVTLHGGNAGALTSVQGATLAADYSFTFTVEMP